MGRGKTCKEKGRREGESKLRTEKKKKMERRLFCKRQSEREGLVRKKWGDKERKGYCGFKAMERTPPPSLNMQPAYLASTMLTGPMGIT